ncbi:MAG: dTDP-4-dehydrorhamnose reductase [Planctomycetota bacterium]
MPGKRRLLITGHKGILGRQLLEWAPADVEILGFDLPEDDITDLAKVVAAVRAFAPDQVLHAAAYTDVDGCELDPARALRVNGLGTRNVAQAASECGSELLYVSTDYVFDGEAERPYEEYDAVRPLSVYGRSKLWGECAVRDHSWRFYIVRTQWLFGVGGRNFVDTIRKAASERDRLRVVSDQVGSPTYAKDLAQVLHRILAERPGYGIYHASSQGECSWWEFAKVIVELAGLEAPVDPMSSAELDRPAPRPRYAVLRNRALELTLGDPFRPWREAVAEYLRGA